MLLIAVIRFSSSFEVEEAEEKPKQAEDSNVVQNAHKTVKKVRGGPFCFLWLF